MGDMSQLNAIDTPSGRFPSVFYPSETGGNAPGLLLLHGSDGLQDHHHAFAERLARTGYAVLVPQWFGPSTPHAHWDGITRNDLELMWETLACYFGVLSNRCGLIGFCRGGGLALVAASFLQNVRVVIDYFGINHWEGGLEELTGLQWGRWEGPTLEFVGRIAAKVLVLHGETDSVVDCESSRKLAKACTYFDIACEPRFFPGTEHAFCWNENVNYNPRIDREAYEAVEAFLGRNLGR